ncbi:hypothetical protein [Sorangium sp. So ce131]|uniref:hypothetical protein n=1 Tax=Sorangium sp. So ce131 TaxID=3133282 RepID=UPI003F5F76FF
MRTRRSAGGDAAQGSARHGGQRPPQRSTGSARLSTGSARLSTGSARLSTGSARLSAARAAPSRPTAGCGCPSDR